MILRQWIIDLQKEHKATKIMAFIFGIASIAFAYLIYSEIVDKNDGSSPDPSVVMNFILADLISILGLALFSTRVLFKRWLGSKYDGSGVRLQNRIVLIFCLVAAIPTITISIASSYFFNFGIQSWFDQKVNTVLHQSVIVAEAYVKEHTTQLKSIAFDVADDLDDMYFKLNHDPNMFSKVLNAQAEMRGLDEAIVFQRDANRVLAQTSMSFSLSFASIPAHLIERADKGEVVEVKTDPTKIRMLIKLDEYYSNTYLLIGRLIDKEIIDHIDKTSGAASEYLRLKSQITSMQIKFSLIFIAGAMLLMLISIGCGMIFAAYIVRPIKQLVLATEKVKSGDLSVSVQEGHHDDELSILSAAFNRMIKQINHQQRDLIVAQRALAWSDVARRVAHEIKNPLTPIQLSAERLGKKFSHEVQNPEEFNQYVQTILRHTQDIGRIVSDFVSFAKMPNPIFEKVNLIKALSDVVASRKAIHEKITYRFETNLKDLEFICDITQINQVMLNLLKNAEEAIETKEAKIITLDVAKRDNLLTVTVRDTGSGIPPELLDSIAEPYVTTRTKGTGLGLAIVQKIIQDHAGIMEISNSDRGAQIKLLFDLDQLQTKKIYPKRT